MPHAEKSLPLKLACDEMLSKLSRWLRFAGYDTWTPAPGMSDREIIKQVKKEKRLLLTRDRALGQLKNADDFVVILYGNTLEECIHELNKKRIIDWQYAPFSRCSLCNIPLERVNTLSHPQLPVDVRREHTLVFRCPACHRLYWPGGHFRRMLKKLRRFSRL